MARYAIALAKNNENGQKCYLSGLLGASESSGSFINAGYLDTTEQIERHMLDL